LTPSDLAEKNRQYSVKRLKCGFQTSEAHKILLNIQKVSFECKNVLFVTMIQSFHALPNYRDLNDKICFIALVDSESYRKHYSKNINENVWKIVDVGDWEEIGNSHSLVAHALRVLGPVIFPTADILVYHDMKPTHIPNNPELVFSNVANTARTLKNHSMLVWEHPKPKHDVFNEFIDVLKVLVGRRIKNSKNHLLSIRGADFADIMRQYVHYVDVGFPMFRTGMSDNGLIIWLQDNESKLLQNQKFACLWHNELYKYSMRTQLSFLYIVWVLDAYDQIGILTRDSIVGPEAKVLIDSTFKVGDVSFDDYW
jgi:hypothetical protein